MNYIYKNIGEYNPNMKRNISIAFEDMTADILSNTKGRKLNISLLFITQSYFALPKNIRLNSTHFLL